MTLPSEYGEMGQVKEQIALIAEALKGQAVKCNTCDVILAGRSI